MKIEIKNTKVTFLTKEVHVVNGNLSNGIFVAIEHSFNIGDEITYEIHNSSSVDGYFMIHTANSPEDVNSETFTSSLLGTTLIKAGETVSKTVNFEVNAGAVAIRNTNNINGSYKFTY